jgi:hypothetical protein
MHTEILCKKNRIVPCKTLRRINILRLSRYDVLNIGDHYSYNGDHDGENYDAAEASHYN